MSATQRLARTFYRAMLRASGRGRYPEVFGEYAARASNVTPPPSDAKQVRAALRNVLLEENSNNTNNVHNDMFAALRRCNELASILHPRIELLSSLPIFEYNSMALMGEQLEFNFFEPRYKLLVSQATCMHGMFIIRAMMEPDGDSTDSELSILVKIVEQKELSNSGNILVRCIGGPRLQVLSQEQVPVPEEGAPPLTRATRFELVHDDDESDYSSQNQTDLIAMRAHCLDLLAGMASKNSFMFPMGLPPLDAEPFSFWALRFVIAHNDIFSRLTWLSCRSTHERLVFVMKVLEDTREERQR